MDSRPQGYKLSHLPAREWNEVVSAVNAVNAAVGTHGVSVRISEAGLQIVGPGVGSSWAPLTRILPAGNLSTAADLDPHAPCGLRWPCVTEGQSGYEQDAALLEEQVLQLEVRPPTAKDFGRIGVTLEGILQGGGSGLVAVSGLALVYVKVGDADFVPAFDDANVEKKRARLKWVDVAIDPDTGRAWWWFKLSSVGFRLLWIAKPASDGDVVPAIVDLSTDSGENWAIVKNVYAGEMPVAAPMKCTWDKDNDRYSATRPTAASQGQILFNDRWNARAQNEIFRVAVQDVYEAKFSGTAPAAGESAGTVANQWYLQRNNTGFLSFGYDDGAGEGLARVRPFNAGGAEIRTWGGSVNYGPDIPPWSGDTSPTWNLTGGGIGSDLNFWLLFLTYSAGAHYLYWSMTGGSIVRTHLMNAAEEDVAVAEAQNPIGMTFNEYYQGSSLFFGRIVSTSPAPSDAVVAKWKVSCADSTAGSLRWSGAMYAVKMSVII